MVISILKEEPDLFFLMEITNACLKNTQLTSILNTHFKGRVNLARVKFISYFIIALCKVQTVGFKKLANAFDAGAKKESSLGRTQRFWNVLIWWRVSSGSLEKT